MEGSKASWLVLLDRKGQEAAPEGRHQDAAPGRVDHHLEATNQNKDEHRSMIPDASRLPRSQRRPGQRGIAGIKPWELIEGHT